MDPKREYRMLTPLDKIGHGCHKNGTKDKISLEIQIQMAKSWIQILAGIQFGSVLELHGESTNSPAGQQKRACQCLLCLIHHQFSGRTVFTYLGHLCIPRFWQFRSSGANDTVFLRKRNKWFSLNREIPNSDPTPFSLSLAACFLVSLKTLARWSFRR